MKINTRKMPNIKAIDLMQVIKVADQYFIPQLTVA